MGVNPNDERLPFEINRADSRSLVQQMVDGIKAAVLAGKYKPGDRLPSVRTLAEKAGVSLIVSRTAIRRLADARVVTTHRRDGTVIMSDTGKAWRGRVVLVVPESDGNYAINVAGGAIRNYLACHGLRFEVVSVPSRNGKYDFTFLDQATELSVDLLLVMYDRKDVMRHIRSLGVPFVVVMPVRGDVRNAVGVVRISNAQASEAIARNCVVCGAHEFLEVGFCPVKTGMMNALLQASGLKADYWKIEIDAVQSHVSVADGVAEAFESRLSKNGKRWLPEVLYFNDDYVATGALMALLHHGICIPEDVKVVTFANLGHGPAFYKPMTRVVLDSVALGEFIAKSVIEYMKAKTWGCDTVFELNFVQGDTF